MSLHTTLALLREHGACGGRYFHIREALGPEYGDETLIPLVRVLDLDGLDDVLWALRMVPGEQRVERDRLARLFACDCAERVLPIWEQRFPEKTSPRRAVATARRFAFGVATAYELAIASSDAWNVVQIVMDSITKVARSVAWAALAAWETTGDASDTAWAAAWAAREAALDVSESAGAAEQEWQAQRFREYLEGERG